MLKPIFLTALALAVCIARPAEAGIVISGSTEQVVGPGRVTFNVIATARDQSETVSGFMVPVMLLNGAQFMIGADDFTENAVFDIANESDLSGGTFGFNAIASGSVLSIGIDESVSLFELTLNLPSLPDGTTVVGNILDGAAFDLSDENQQPIANLSIGAPLTVIAVPEPSSLACLGLAGIASYWRRRGSSVVTAEG